MKSTCYPLPEGSYTVGMDKKFIPFDELTDNIKDRPASLLVQIQPFLIKTPNSLLLLDCGLGYQLSNGQLHLHQNIRNCGFEPEEVTHVLLSHLHFDHVGGAVINQSGKLSTSFPNASYYAQQGELEKAQAHPSKSYRPEILDTLQNSGQLNLLQGNGVIGNEIHYEITGGHTEFHQAFTITTGAEKFFFGGDVVPDLYQLIRRFVAKYDFDGKHSADMRRELAIRAAESNSTLLFYHSIKMPMCRLKYADGMFSVAD